MIRKFEEKDISSCAELIMDVYNNEMWKCRWTKESAVKYIKEYVMCNRFVGFVYEEEANIIGGILSHEKVWWNQDEIFLDELFVSPHRQRSGIGSLLITELEKYCKERQLAGITLSTNKYAPAPLFYKKIGFETAEHVMYMYKI